MILGIPKEIKPQEYRVSLTPEAVGLLVRAGHQVLVQKGAGLDCGFSDQAFRDNGAVIVSTAAAIWRDAHLVVKVKEPLPKEYSFFRPDLILFTFLHLASAPSLTKALVKRGVTAVGYETVTAPDGSLPLLKPMSRIAGKLAVLLGAEYLRTDRGEKGILLSPVEGATPGRVTILGAGNVGRAALEVAEGIGAHVTIFDRSEEKLQRLGNGRTETLLLDRETLSRRLPETDLLIGAVLIPGAKAPKLVTRGMVSQMQKGSVIVDVSVDQGACVETIRPTTHARPTYLYKGIVHYGVTNMPSLVARSATEALVHSSLPYVQKLAGEGFEALRGDPGFGRGLQVHRGEIVHEEVRRAISGSSRK
jgi:alanine dehydrogenase